MSATRSRGRLVAEIQRQRILAAVVAVVGECGYADMTVARIVARAGVSRQTFYEQFESSEAAFLAAYEQSVQRIASAALPPYRDEEEWGDRVRAGLAALLRLFDDEPALARLVVVEVYAAGPRALAARRRLLEQLRELLLDGAEPALFGGEPPPLVPDALLGSVGSIIHRRLCNGPPEPLSPLLGSLMHLLVNPYLGPAAAEQELRRPAPRARPRQAPERSTLEIGRELLDRHGMRPGFRTLRVLEVIAERPGLNNRQIAQAAGDVNEGQISRLLSRLRNLGLIESTSPANPGHPRAWRLVSEDAG